jgi:hypothetical protein
LLHLTYRLDGRLPRNIAHTHKTTKLSKAKELALYKYIDRLDRINLSLRKELIRAAADYILQESAQPGEAIQTVGNDWVTRFIERYGYIIIKQKALEQDR